LSKDLSTEKGENSQPIKQIKKRMATTGGCPYNMQSVAKNLALRKKNGWLGLRYKKSDRNV
jgi:hypothetical protein